MKTLIIFVLVFGFIWTGCTGTLAQEGVTTVTDFSVPEYDDEGNLTTELLGDYADIMPDGSVHIRNLRIISYRNNAIDMSVTAPQCEYLEQEKRAVSDANVRISRDNMVVTGQGFSWNSADERLVIESQVKVVLKNVRKHVKTDVKTGDEI